MKNQCICFKGLSPRTVSANPHQKSEFIKTVNDDDQCTVVQRFDQLATHLNKAYRDAVWLSDMTGANFMQAKISPLQYRSPRRGVVVQMMSADDDRAEDARKWDDSENDERPTVPRAVAINDGRGTTASREANTDDKLVSENPPRKSLYDVGGGTAGRKPEVSNVDDGRSGSSSEILLITEDKSVQVNISDWADAENEGRERAAEPKGALWNGNSCVDLKSLMKLRKLCCLLWKNVKELKTVHEKWSTLKYAYTESEHAGMDSGLVCLENDVMRLTREVDNIAGYPDEIRRVAESYKVHESHYRELRSLKKKARSRYKGLACRAKEEDDQDKKTSGFQRTLTKYLCRPCYRIYKKVHDTSSKINNRDVK